MSDLISRKALNDALIEMFQGAEDLYIAGMVIGLVNMQPTAYDTDKVIKQLAMNSHRVETHEYGSERVVRLIDATYIVKGIYEEISRGEFDKAIKIVKGASNETD